MRVKNMNKELFPTFNSKGTFLGNVTREELYHEDQENNYYRVVHNIVYLPTDGHTKQIWVQKRASGKFWGGYLVSTASGHLHAGETPRKAMLREVQEELFNNIPTKWNFKKLGSDLFFKPDYPGYKGGMQRISVFVSESDGSNFSPSSEEVEKLYPMSLDELKTLAKDPDSLLVPDFRLILQKKNL